MAKGSTSRSEESGGGCPVKHREDAASDSSSKCPVNLNDGNNNKSPNGLMAWLLNRTETPVNKSSSSSSSASTVSSVEEAARYAQTPQPGQRIPLATDREMSSIPRGSKDTLLQGETLPAHQHEIASTSDNNNNKDEDHEQPTRWVYPSEQQLYNAMIRKGWNNVPAESIPLVLRIHNHINERTWTQIQDWEGSTDIQLVRFQGRPNDLSPKAWFWSRFLRLYDPPFDRHDWYIQPASTNTNNTWFSFFSGTFAATLGLSSSSSLRQTPSSSASSGFLQRYVIDYYYMPSKHPDQPPIPYIDARPAMDHPRALWLKTRRFLQLAFPGITSYLKRRQIQYQQQQQQQQQLGGSTDDLAFHQPSNNSTLSMPTPRTQSTKSSENRPQ